LRNSGSGRRGTQPTCPGRRPGGRRGRRRSPPSPPGPPERRPGTGCFRRRCATTRGTRRSPRSSGTRNGAASMIDRDVPGPGLAAPADALLVTALPLERAAVRRHLTGLSQVARNGIVADAGRSPAGDRQLHVLVIETGPGNVNAALAVERAVAA